MIFNLSLQKAGNVAVLEAAKCTNAFPSGATRDLYAACPAFSKIVKFQSNKIMNAISYVIEKKIHKDRIQRYKFGNDNVLLVQRI